MSRAKSLVLCFWNDQTGFIISAELVLIATLLVIGLIVGLTSVQSAVVGELNDVGAAIGSLNQSYSYTGFASRKFAGECGLKAFTAGSLFQDVRDECDADLCGAALSCGTIDPTPEVDSPRKHIAPEHKKNAPKAAKKKDKEDDDV